MTAKPVLRLIVYKAAAGVKSKELAPITAMEVTSDAVQLSSRSGVLKYNRIEQYFRDVKVFKIIEGSNQIQHNIIGKYLVRTH